MPLFMAAFMLTETTVNTTTTTQEQEVKPEIVGTGQQAVPVITANG